MRRAFFFLGGEEEIGPEEGESGERSPLGGEPRLESKSVCCEKIGSRPEIGRGILAVKNVTHEQKKVRSPDQPEHFREDRLPDSRMASLDFAEHWIRPAPKPV